MFALFSGHATTSLKNNRRRFRANKRGYYAFWIFIILFTISLCAEFIANDRPIVIISQQQWYWPVFQDYTEQDLGGELPLLADYQDPYMLQQLEQNSWVIWPWIPFSAATVDYQLTQPAPTAPSAKHWLGTDDQGRDVLARVIYGFRISVWFALVLTSVSALIGIVVGAFSGFYAGILDLSAQRFLEIWSGLPVLFLLLILSSFVQPGFWWLLLMMLLFQWTGLVDLVRAEFLKGRNLEYVDAARVLGVSNVMIMFRHILPNAMVASLTFIPFMLTGAITMLTALDFLGYGLPPGSASLGELVIQGKSNLQAPWLGITAFVTLALILSLLVFIGEAVRDAFDPRKKSPYSL